MMKITASFRNVTNEPKAYINAEKRTSVFYPGFRDNIPFVSFMTFSVSRP